MALEIMERPRFGPYLKEFYGRHNKQVFLQKLQYSTSTAASKIPSLLDTISKGIALLGAW